MLRRGKLLRDTPQLPTKRSRTSNFPSKMSSHRSLSLLALILLFSLSICPAISSTTLSQRRSKSALHTPSYPQGYLTSDGSHRLPHRVSLSIRQICDSQDQTRCPTSDKCCNKDETCCSHGCCPSSYPICSTTAVLCLNDKNLTQCINPQTNTVFAGSPCSVGPACCGQDQVFRFCPKIDQPQCVDVDGFFPCMINFQFVRGVVCGSNTCCPNPMRCCGDRCCNRDGDIITPPQMTGIPTAMASPSATASALPSDESPTTPDLSPEVSPEMSLEVSLVPSAEASVGASWAPENSVDPSVEVSLAPTVEASQKADASWTPELATNSPQWPWASWPNLPSWTPGWPSISPWDPFFIPDSFRTPFASPSDGAKSSTDPLLPLPSTGPDTEIPQESLSPTPVWTPASSHSCGPVQTPQTSISESEGF